MEAQTIRLTVNGVDHRVETTAFTVVDLLRGDLGLTGTKEACGGGQCGSCVVSVDGAPMASCLLPVEHVEGTSIVTVEGLGGDQLHAIQRAFIVEDALQCGFCTPGFLIEAAAFCDAWRAERGDVEPGADDVERALAGHLCRCGAYRSIMAAVRGVCAGRFDEPGVPVGRPDALDKVTGAAVYTVDVRLPHMAHGAIVRSDQPHADVLSVDIHQAADLEGFLAWTDLMDGKHRVRYAGQPIGAVAAETVEAARTIAAAVEIVYKPISAVITAGAALADGAPNIHARGWRPPSSNEAASLPNVRRGNLRGPTVIGSTRPMTARRRLRAGAERHDPLLIEETWRVHPQAHTALEPHACVADWRRGEPILHVSTQGVSSLAAEVASHYDLETTDVTVLADHVGGAFGSKHGMTEEVVAAVELSRRTGVPVAVVYDRQEELTVGGHRPAAELDLAAVWSADRSLSALSISAKSNGGASAGQLTASWGRLIYPGAPRILMDYDVLTNCPPAKPFRAPGGPGFAWAMEQAVDEMAGRLGVDPISLRRGWSPSPRQERLMDWVEAHPRWLARSGHRTAGRHRHGVGVAFSTWFYAFDPDTRVRVLVADGRIEVSSGVQDMGNGTKSVLRDAVCEELGVDPSVVEVRVGNSTLSPGPTSSGSMTTASVGPAAAAAARTLAGRMAGAAASIGYPNAVVGPGGIVHAGESIAWQDILDELGVIEVEEGRPRDTHRPFLPFAVSGMQPGWGLTGAAHLVELSIDMETGRVRPIWSGAVMAVGHIYSPRQAASQVEGGVIQGLSYALHEEWVIDPLSGIVVSSDFDHYRIAGLADTPEIEVHFIDEGFEYAAGGGVGLSELATVGVAAAVGNAVAAATGQRPFELPLRPGPVMPP